MEKRRVAIKKPRALHNLKTGKLHVIRPDATRKAKMCAAAGRIGTGIASLDRLMGGGFKRGSVNLVGGGPGSGKSILCMQFLVEGIINHNENAIYISFEQDVQTILDDFKCFDWDIENLVKERKLVILYYTPQQVEKVLESGGGIVQDTIESIHAKRLVIDSLTAFTLLHENNIERQYAVLRLFDNARKWGVTALMTSQQEQDPQSHPTTALEFETDAVVLLYNVRKGANRQRGIEIFKMRGSAHSTLTYPFDITDRGVSVKSRPMR